MSFSKFFYLFGSLFGLSAVILDSLCAHFFKNKIPTENLQQLNLATRYVFLHGIMLILCAVIKNSINLKIINVSGVLFVIGVLLFCGTLIIKNIFQIYTLAKLAPLGGVCLISAWLSLIISAIWI